jgi:hypothetical protein
MIARPRLMNECDNRSLIESAPEAEWLSNSKTPDAGIELPALNAFNRTANLRTIDPGQNCEPTISELCQNFAERRPRRRVV